RRRFGLPVWLGRSGVQIEQLRLDFGSRCRTGHRCRRRVHRVRCRRRRGALSVSTTLFACVVVPNESLQRGARRVSTGTGLVPLHAPPPPPTQPPFRLSSSTSLYMGFFIRFGFILPSPHRSCTFLVGMYGRSLVDVARLGGTHADESTMSASTGSTFVAYDRRGGADKQSRSRGDTVGERRARVKRLLAKLNNCTWPSDAA
ncbi:hypothetical protein BMF94_4766, partial [Rhodotorula taiwanensis]